MLSFYESLILFVSGLDLGYGLALGSQNPCLFGFMPPAELQTVSRFGRNETLYDGVRGGRSLASVKSGSVAQLTVPIMAVASSRLQASLLVWMLSGKEVDPV